MLYDWLFVVLQSHQSEPSATVCIVLIENVCSFDYVSHNSSGVELINTASKCRLKLTELLVLLILQCCFN